MRICYWLVMGVRRQDGGREPKASSINSKETIEALKYGKALVRDFHPRHAILARPVQQQGFDRGRGQR